MAKDNKTLGRFILDGIPPAPRGIPQVEVTFKIDANGILHVSAKDKASGKEQSITITASTQLDDKEVDELVKEAAKHAEDDKKARSQVETKNEAESLAFQVEKFVDEMKDKLEEDAKKELAEKAKELKEMAGKDDFNSEELKTKTDELSKFLQEQGAKMYQKAAEEVKTEESSKSPEGDEQGSSSDSESKTSEEPAEGEVIDKDKG
jgi:molecular chaperone DnaK